MGRKIGLKLSSALRFCLYPHPPPRAGQSILVGAACTLTAGLGAGIRAAQLRWKIAWSGLVGLGLGAASPCHPSQAGGQVSRAVGPDFRAMGLARGHSHHPPASVRPAEPPPPPPQPVCSVSFLKGYFSPPPLPNLSPHHHRRVKNSWRNRLLSPQFFASSCRTQASHPPHPNKFNPCLVAWGRGKWTSFPALFSWPLAPPSPLG